MKKTIVLISLAGLAGPGAATAGGRPVQPFQEGGVMEIRRVRGGVASTKPVAEKKEMKSPINGKGGKKKEDVTKGGRK
jgi:hypothetical protein